MCKNLCGKFAVGLAARIGESIAPACELIQSFPRLER